MIFTEINNFYPVMTNINRFPKEGSVMKIIVGPKAVIRFVISKQVVCKFIYIFLKVSLVLFSAHHTLSLFY